MRGITSITFVRAAESVRRPGLARSSGEVRSEPWHTFVVALMGERANGSATADHNTPLRHAPAAEPSLRERSVSDDWEVCLESGCGRWEC